MAILKRKLKSGKYSYLVRVRDSHGQWYPAQQFPTKELARAHEGALLGQKQKGSKAKSVQARELSLNDYYVEKWSKDCRAKVSPGWRDSQDQMYRDHIGPIIGSLTVVEIDQSNIGSVLTKCVSKGLGTQMQIHILNLLNRMFDDSIHTYGYRESNPVSKKQRPKLHAVERDFLKPSGVDEFLDSVADHWLGAAFWIMTLCGLRCGEMQALKVGDVFLADPDPYILVREQWKRKEKRFGSLKNGKPLRVPMPPVLVDYLRRKLATKAQTEFVVQTKRGLHISHSTLYKAVKRLTEAYSLSDLSPHELRHTCTEYWKDAGATSKDLQNLLNHSSEASTRKYEHRVEERLNRIAKNIGQSKKTPPALAIVKG